MRAAIVLPLFISLLWLATCSATPPTAEPGPPPTYSPVAAEPLGAKPVDTEPVIAAPPVVQTSIPAAGDTAMLVADAGAAQPAATNSSCPAGMVLVEGDYCTKVKHRCLVEWYAPQNKKRVCEKFAKTATCVGKRVHKRFCIDKYAWPNKKGVRPEVMNNFYQAQVKCAAMGKRMCTESEWNFACEGPNMKPFPHGYVRDPRKCNGHHKWDNPNMKKVRKRDAQE